MTGYFHAPTDFSELVELMSEPNTTLVAGGTALVPLIKERLVEPSHLVWVGQVRGMATIELSADGLMIGGATSLKHVGNSELVKQVAPAVAKAARSVGNSRVRSVATIGGAIAHADPRQDLPPALLAADARVVVAAAERTREMRLRESFFVGFMTTAMKPEDVIKSVVIPRVESVEDYFRFTPSSPEHYPTMSIAVRLHSGSSQPAFAVGLGGLADTPLFLEHPSFDPTDHESMSRFVKRIRDYVSPIDDELGSADYKRWVAGVWAERMVGRLLARENAADS